MALDPLDRPDQGIVPNPCGEAETNRNWDAVRRIVSNIYNSILNGQAGGTLMAEVQLAPDPVTCVEENVDVVFGTFRPLFIEDPANPMIRPTTVKNYRGLGVYETLGVKPKAYIAYDPNDTSEQVWEIIEIDHVPVTILSDAEFQTGQGIHFTGMLATVIPCGPAADDVGVDIATVTARAIYNQSITSASGCSVVSNEVEMEVFSKTLDATDYVEYTFDSLNVLTDAYQSTPYGNILGYYYLVYVPCATLVGEDLLIYVDRCLSGSG
jgi:hypothetical protein